MTEDEAKLKWCPDSAGAKALATIASILPSLPALNHGFVQPDELAEVLVKSEALKKAELCLGSQCMAWITDGDNTGHCGRVFDRSTIWSETTNHY